MTPYDGERNTRELGLLMRYHATADRGFNKCLADLRKLQKERRLEEIGFVSQKPIPSRYREEADPVVAQTPDAPVEKRPESDRPWAKFFNRAPITSPNAAGSPALATQGQA